MLRKTLYAVVGLLLVVGTMGWAKPTSAQSTRPTRCVIFLEPIQPGESSSKASTPVCSTGKVDSVNGYSLATSYLIVRFYDNTNYNTLLVEYYGGSACSPSISYGVESLPSNLNNKFASGMSYSNCNYIWVYDFSGYGGPSWTCAGCSTFYALNDHVTSWRVTYSL